MEALSVLQAMVSVILIVVAINYLQKHRKIKKELYHYITTYLYKHGWVPEFGQYTILSLDGGAHWYNVAQTRGRGDMYTVEGPADLNLISQLGLQELINHANTHLPFDEGELTEDDRRILENADIVNITSNLALVK